MSSGSKYKDIMKKGWHPEKPGTTIKGQVNGLLHRKKPEDDRSGHVSVPLSRLKDPASFAPPPKRTGSGLAPPPPPSASAPRKVVAAPSKYADPRTPVVEETQVAEPEEEEEPKQRGPYRANTTGLATSHLPKPPGRRDGADGRPAEPPSYQSAMAAVGGRSAPPSLPPRLPPRTNSSSTVSSGAASPAPSSNPLINQGALNQGAVSRLSAAGVSVPAFGIGRSSPAATESEAPPKPPRPGVASPPATPSHMNELQNRFSKLGTSNANANATEPPSEGTTWAQKQAALKTASAFQKDPSSVSFSDARAAASTANNFRQRHGEQVAAGAKAANNLNQKYGLMDKAKSSYASVQGTQQDQGAQAGAASPSLSGLVGKKKPPPPPPKKKPALAAVTPSAPADDDAPPPIPMATRPQF
ncbi:hypothetical protein N0V84_004875 [Fusarium piperis]|uniref:GMP synthase n=1 Tax=Fusarium piperis TaxID=1435070 RepID=A0A9W9BQ01_9HYPO|nr:hypothetical protein N0V84_004875 [Fusarium piperis]